MKFDAAQAAYEVGDFERARQLYSDAYELAPLPALLFDIGQCHRKLGQWSQAAFYFRRYVAHAPADVDTSRVEELIAQMETHKPSLEPSRPVRVLAVRAVTAPPMVVIDDNPEPPLYTRWWFWAGAGFTTVVVAAVGVAVGASLSASSAQAPAPAPHGGH